MRQPHLALMAGALVLVLGFSAAPRVEAMTYQEWAGGYFAVLDAPEAAPGADPDDDLLTNVEEYAFLLDPMAPDVAPAQGELYQHTDGQHYLAVVFPHRPEATDLRYEVRSEEDLTVLCQGEVPYLRRNGTVVHDDGLAPGAPGELPPGWLRVLDPAVPLESGVERGFLKVFVSLTEVADPLTFVRIGDPGEAGVANVFDMGEFEVTNEQFAVFLNAVAAADDGRKAYSPFMETQPQGGIRRHGTFGQYRYSVKPGMEKKPVAFVRFWAACRFCNWLHHGKPLYCGEMNAGTTEDGAYDLTFADTAMADRVVRKPGARFFVPNEEEWLKAAHYDRETGSFWNYATGSNEEPLKATADSEGNINNDTDNIANFHRRAVWDSEGDGISEANVTTVGSGGPGSRSAYGAADMTGNVAEWTDTAVLNWGRIQRGGSWNHLPIQIQRWYRFPMQTFPDSTKDTGFRVARPVAP